MKLWTFIKSPSGNVVLFVGVVLVGAAMVWRSHARDKARAEQMTRVETPAPSVGRESIQRTGVPLKIPPAPLWSEKPKDDTPAESRPHVVRQRSANQPAKSQVLPISLFTGSSGTGSEADELSKIYAPYGRMIPCETVVTIESSSLDTPVIGLVTEDVWHEGRLVIPAGVEVHGRASLDRSRERIAISGKWVVVWRDGSALNGTELVLSGIALDRERNDVTGEFGLRDGSAGLVGRLIRSDNWQEIKLFAATFLSGMASGFMEMQDQTTAYGGVWEVPKASGRNAALQGTADVLNLYAKRIQEVIERDGFYVRVPAGKQFYLYVTETLDQGKGTRGNVRIGEIWRKESSHETNPPSR
ncbi:hypothetical protein OPIT5_23450 [Opitutaceae bacterium TAV5]|nr:hypothetical protein OPIT5_23450 [Opitutaceae bacterium TAV5]